MIKANFKAYSNYVTDSLYQWDINQDLVINGLNLEDAPEVHFANANMDRAIVRQSTLENGVVTVVIPNSLLQEALTIKAYVGIYEGDTFKVVEKIEIPIIAKARPYDYVFEDTDEELYSFKYLENLFNSTLEESLANYNEATEKYKESVGEFESLIGEYAGIPDRVDELERLGAKIATGTYSGGGDGVTIPVDFKPKLLVVGGPGYGGSGGIKNATFCVPYGQTSLYVSLWDALTLFSISGITWSDNSISWSGLSAQSANESGHTYRFVVIG